MTTQEITLIVYALPDKRRWIICEHSPLVHEAGELYLRADLSCHAIAGQCPQEAGLHRMKVRARLQSGAWGGCRLDVLSHTKLCGSLEDVLAAEDTDK